MHYYKRNIGDYNTKAGRLSMLQHGAYTLLMDACYDREKFPTEEDAINWCWASDDSEIAAVKFVLNRFFKLEDGVYVQKHIKEVIDKYHQNAATNKRIAQEREAKRREKSTKRTRSVHEAPPNQEPRTINQELLTKNQELKPTIPEWIDRELWDGFMEVRKKLKAVNTELAIKKLLNNLEKMKNSGLDPNQAISASIENSWKGVFDPKGKPVITDTRPQGKYIN